MKNKMPIKFKWIGKKKYYWNGKYYSWQEAYNVARYHKRKNPKCQYWIEKVEDAGFFNPTTIYVLYMTKVARWGIW